MTQYPQTWIYRKCLPKQLEGVVVAAVIDIDHFVVVTTFQRSINLADERQDVVLLVSDWYDDG